MKKLNFMNGSIQAGVTLKDSGLPEKGNQALHVAQKKEDVLNNRKNLALETLPLDFWILPHQTHSHTVKQVFKKDRKSGAYETESAVDADALYTFDPECLIGVYTADCCGIVLTDPENPFIGVIHSGWKGTVQAITLKTLQEIIEKGVNPANLRVFFSPSLLFDSFEVGPEVVEQLRTMAEENGLDISGCIKKGKGDRFYIDNQGINQLMLKKAGVPEENIFLSQFDTARDEESCFSFRRDKPLGEHFTYAWIEKIPGPGTEETEAFIL